VAITPAETLGYVHVTVYLDAGTIQSDWSYLPAVVDPFLKGQPYYFEASMFPEGALGDCLLQRT
jgi:hypothetical protein